MSPRPQHPMGITSFVFAIINILMTVVLLLPCLEFSVIGIICALIAFHVKSEKYANGLAVAGLVFSIVEGALCVFLGVDFAFRNVSFLASLIK